jgi:GT2 family glycosyltransferase
VADVGASPALSVVIPVLDGERYLGEQLEALSREHVAGGFEVLVCDNGSTDGSGALASSFEDRLPLRIVDGSAHRGQTYARNTGAAAGTAPALLFLDQDDVVAPGYLAVMHRALAAHELVAARVDTERLNPGWVGKTREIAQSDGLPGGSTPWAYGCTLGISKARFEQLGGFDTQLYVSAEDVDLCWRAAKDGVDLVFVPDAVLHYRFPDTYRALFRQGRRYGIGQVAVNKKHGLPRDSFGAWLRRMVGTLRLLLSANERGARGKAMFLLGRRLGMLEGSVRYRTWYG